MPVQIYKKSRVTSRKLRVNSWMLSVISRKFWRNFEKNVISCLRKWIPRAFEEWNNMFYYFHRYLKGQNIQTRKTGKKKGILNILNGLQKKYSSTFALKIFFFILNIRYVYRATLIAKKQLYWNYILRTIKLYKINGHVCL